MASVLNMASLPVDADAASSVWSIGSYRSPIDEDEVTTIASGRPPYGAHSSASLPAARSSTPSPGMGFDPWSPSSRLAPPSLLQVSLDPQPKLEWSAQTFGAPGQRQQSKPQSQSNMQSRKQASQAPPQRTPQWPGQRPAQQSAPTMVTQAPPRPPPQPQGKQSGTQSPQQFLPTQALVAKQKQFESQALGKSPAPGQGKWPQALVQTQRQPTPQPRAQQPFANPQEAQQRPYHSQSYPQQQPPRAQQMSPHPRANQRQQTAPRSEPIVEVVLECVHAAGVNVKKLPLNQKAVGFHTWEIPHGLPWSMVMGRQAQPGFFERLIPDSATHMQISRSHFELSIVPDAPDSVMLRLLSDSPGICLWADSAMVAHVGMHHTTLIDNSTLCLSHAGDGCENSFFALRVLLRGHGEVAARGPHEAVAPAVACIPVPHVPLGDAATAAWAAMRANASAGGNARARY